MSSMFTAEQHGMLSEAGFEPCYVRDVTEGSVIAINHETNYGTPTEMTVVDLWVTGGGNLLVIAHWIGVLPDGRKVHCAYNESYPCWMAS